MAFDVSDIETALGRTLTPTEHLQAVQWVDDALMLIEARLGDPTLLTASAVDYVVREAVVARFHNPEGYQSESIDDYTYRHGAETRRITILPEWWELLSPAATAYTIAVSSPLDVLP